AFVSWRVFDQTEDRLLEQRTKESAAVLEVAVSQVRTPLDGAAQVASITEGDPEAFARPLTSLLGENRLFSSAVLFRVGSADPISVVGNPPALLDQPATMREKVAAGDAPFMVVDLLSAGRRLGYAVTDDAESPKYVVYAERILNPDP